ncbi:SH3 domain protein, partial [Opisthorchis viverrini]
MKVDGTELPLKCTDSENQEELLSFNQEYVEHKVEEIQFAIRREEIERVKIEACLGLLRNSAVEVKQFVAEARAAADAAVSAALAQQLRETDGGLISDLRVTSHLSDRPTGEGSSDSVSSSVDNQRIFSRHYATPHGSRSNTIGAGYLARGHTHTESSYSIRANTLGSDKWTSAAPRPATIGQASSRKPGNGTVTPNRTTAWGSLRAINSASHDYQNVEPTLRAHDDLSMDKTRTQHGSLGRREHKSNDALVNESLDLELLWSDHGRLQQASVLHEFRAKRPDELDLVMHETVVLLDPAGSSGWVKVRSLIDGNEGLVPLNYLRLHQPQIRSRSQLETDNEDEVEASQLDDKAVPNTSTAADMPPKIANASPYENIVAAPPHVEEEVIKHSKSHLPSYGTKRNSGLHQNSIPTASSDQFQSINAGHGTLPTTPATPDVKKPGKHLPIPGSFVRTLIEFEGNHPDELHFSPGSVIRVLGRAPVPDGATDTSSPDELSPLNRLNNSITSGVDDGWWEGELLVPSSNSAATQQYTRIRGVFPSMLIHPMSSEDAEPWELVWKNSVPNQPELNGDANSDQKTLSSGLQTERTDQDDTIRCTLITTPVSKTDRPDTSHSDGDYIQLKSEQLINSRPVEHGHSPQILTRAMLQQAANDELEDE